MAAYNLSDRFSHNPQYYRFYDPGAYQYDESYKISPSQAPFLSNVPRKTLSCRPIWTHAIYEADLPRKNIPNCTSMMSKVPRFPYEALSKEDLEDILCKCGIPKTCQCPTDEEEKPELEIICQGKVERHIIKGVPPRSGGDSGLSAPSKGDKGFKIFRDGSQKRLKDEVSNESPPFYDARVIEATMFYQGCKWSKWTGTRGTKCLEQSPGPADYTLENPPNEIAVCAEKVRAKKRKESKQYRFIEMVQRRNILENAPGPATYSPIFPKGTELQDPGPKAPRFSLSKYDISPGPADYSPKRDFEIPQPPSRPCQAILPEPACFGVKDKRFKPRKEEGPSPATYCAIYKPCQFQICTKAPFGSNVSRFKATPLDESDSEECINVDMEGNKKVDYKVTCPHHTWEFKSKTIRMKPLVKRWNEQSPADFNPTRLKSKRSFQMQYIAPFNSSDGRFQPWYNWISVFGRLVTPGPGYYNLEQPKCYPAVHHGPLYRDRRFRSPTFQTPTPNEYNIGGGIETILSTHNEKLKNNIEKTHQFHLNLPPQQRVLSAHEKETLLINKCIAICDETMPEESSGSPQDQIKSADNPEHGKYKKKLLRYFLYKHEMPLCN